MKKVDWLMMAGLVLVLGAAGYAAYMFYPRGDGQMVVEPDQKITPSPHPNMPKVDINQIYQDTIMPVKSIAETLVI
jgi:hypothetical protein